MVSDHQAAAQYMRDYSFGPGLSSPLTQICTRHLFPGVGGACAQPNMQRLPEGSFPLVPSCDGSHANSQRFGAGGLYLSQGCHPTQAEEIGTHHDVHPEQE
jgi:hypothetical protein